MSKKRKLAEDDELEREILISEVKQAILDCYDETKYRIEIDCQEVLEELRKRNQDTKLVLNRFEHSLELNENHLNEALNRFNEFIKNPDNLANKTKPELIKTHVHSTIYLKYKDIRKEEAYEDEANVGMLFHFDWFINKNQINFIKVKMLKRKITKNIEFCLDEEFIRVFLACDDTLFNSVENGYPILTGYIRLLQKPFSDVDILDLRTFKIGSVDADCFKEFKSLKDLSICKIKEIPASLFTGLDNLEKIELYFNRELSSLDPNTFKNLKSLKLINLNSCNISIIPDGIFDGLDKLELLGLNSNPITHLKADFFKDLKALRALDLGGLGLGQDITIENGIFDSLVKMETLILSKSHPFGRLQSNAFDKLKSMTMLNMANCDIKSIDKGWFANMQKLNTLALKGNEIENLEVSDFASLKNLKLLEINFTQVTYHKSKVITHEEFKQLMKKIVSGNFAHLKVFPCYTFNRHIPTYN